MFQEEQGQPSLREDIIPELNGSLPDEGVVRVCVCVKDTGGPHIMCTTEKASLGNFTWYSLDWCK